MRITFILALIVIACGAACHATGSSYGGDPSGRRHQPLASLERTVCFGLCPDYKVTIFRDGIVEYEGRHFVKIQGRATGRISARRLAQVRALFERNGYLQLADSYVNPQATDLPYAITSYSPRPGQIKSVRHYLGDFSAPKALTEIENGIDQIVNIEQWIGTPDERRGP